MRSAPTSPVSRPGVPDGVLELCWLGQSGFVLRTSSSAIVIDPWLSPAPARLRRPPPLETVSAPLEWALITHGHDDHFDLEALRALAAQSPAVRLVLPAPHAARGRDVLPATEIITVQPGDVVNHDGVQIQAVPAWHGVHAEDGYSSGLEAGLTPHVGYLLEVDGFTVYHAGDTLAADELSTLLRGVDITVAILPINGRDADREARDILGNLDPREAAELAAAIRPAIVVPAHFDMVRGNTAWPGDFVDELTRLGVATHALVPTYGVPVRIGLTSAEASRVV